MTLARLYGRLLTQSSLSVVTEGFRSALSDAGVLAGVYGIDTQGIPDMDDDSGASARHGVYTGPLDRIGEMFERGKHECYWIMVAPNSNLLPRSLVKQIESYKGKFEVRLLAPSYWAAKIVAEQIQSTPVLTVPHGVSVEYRVQQSLADDVAIRYLAGEFRVLHFSTSAQARKGTLELLQAWMAWSDRPGKARLRCILDYPAKISLRERLLDEAIQLDASVDLVDRADLPPEHLVRVLASAHVVCQPSRGEAFGLVPLEALCTGVPVVATRVTGHTAYLSGGTRGFTEVAVPREETGAATLAAINDLPGSKAPILRMESIGDALQAAEKNFLGLQREAISEAPRMQEQWLWNNLLAAFVQELKHL